MATSFAQNLSDAKNKLDQSIKVWNSLYSNMLSTIASFKQDYKYPKITGISSVTCFGTGGGGIFYNDLDNLNSQFKKIISYDDILSIKKNANFNIVCKYPKTDSVLAQPNNSSGITQNDVSNFLNLTLPTFRNAYNDLLLNYNAYENLLNSPEGKITTQKQAETKKVVIIVLIIVAIFSVVGYLLNKKYQWIKI